MFTTTFQKKSLSQPACYISLIKIIYRYAYTHIATGGTFYKNFSCTLCLNNTIVALYIHTEYYILITNNLVQYSNSKQRTAGVHRGGRCLALYILIAHCKNRLISF